jgi:hypothetical protein
MSLDTEKFENDLKKWMNSDAGKEFFENERIAYERKVQRFKRLEKYLESHDFDELLHRLISEHDDEYREKCRKEGCEDYPNNKLQFVFDYVVYKTPILEPTPSGLECDFPNEVFEFKGYYFQTIYGQGCFIRIYNKEDRKLLLTV